MPITSIENIKRLLATRRFDGGITASQRAEIMGMYESLWHQEKQLAQMCAYARQTRQRDTKQLCKRHADVKAHLDELARLARFVNASAKANGRT